MNTEPRIFLDNRWRDHRRDRPTVKLDGLPFELAVKAFRKKFQRSGLIGELKLRSNYPNPSDRKKQKAHKAIRKQLALQKQR